MLLEYQIDWVKIDDFLVTANFLADYIFVTHTLHVFALYTILKKHRETTNYFALPLIKTLGTVRPPVS